MKGSLHPPASLQWICDHNLIWRRARSSLRSSKRKNAQKNYFKCLQRWHLLLCQQDSALPRQFWLRSDSLVPLREGELLWMLLPRSFKRLFKSVSTQRCYTSSSCRFDIALWKPRRCLAFIHMRTGTDTSFVIPDDKIYQMNIYEKSDHEEKTHYVIQNEGGKDCTYSPSTKYLLHLQSAKMDV